MEWIPLCKETHTILSSAIHDEGDLPIPNSAQQRVKYRATLNLDWFGAQSAFLNPFLKEGRMGSSSVEYSTYKSVPVFFWTKHDYRSKAIVLKNMHQQSPEGQR